MNKFQKGMLVQPSTKVESSYSGYAGRPKMYFDIGMLGVIKSVNNDTVSIQVEYIDPASGCIECARVFKENLDVISWPENCTDLSKVIPENGMANKYWFCGSMSFMGCVQYIKAIALYRYGYLQSIELKTVRVPGVHITRLRTDYPEPYVLSPKNKQTFNVELNDVLAFA